MAYRVLMWIDSRLRLGAIRKLLLDEPIPGGASWIYVFGSIVLFLFIVQAITGMFLVLYYVPSPDHAYDTVQYIQHEVSFGWFVRGLHHWGASAIMLALGLHLLQTYLYGAYKRPRELMWMVGVVLLLFMLAMGFTGYLLPWDQNAYWATQVGTNMTASIPIIGDTVVRLLRGGDTLGALTLSRFFALHVLFLPAILFLGVALHLFILRRVGPAGPWSAERAQQRTEPFYPRQVFMDAMAMLAIFLLVVALATTVEFPLADRADPSDHTFTPIPEWYFLFFYELLKVVPGRWEPVVTWILPSVLIVALFLVPFLDRNTERHPATRPVALGMGAGFIGLVLGLLGYSLWQLHAMPHIDPSVARGQALFAQHHCAACHRIYGEGGKLGPDLSYVADARPYREWHIRHLRDPQSVSPGSIMPKLPLSERELNDLASYLLTLKGGANPPPPSTSRDGVAYAAESDAPMPAETAVGETDAPSIVRDPTDVPRPIRKRAPKTIRVDLEAIELEGRLADGATYKYYTFNGAVPGPFIRVRLHDQVELHLKNRDSNLLEHSIDLHAVTGPGGGSSLMQAKPGEEKAIVFRALKPGLYVYHCATAMVAEHITSGMYGLILVEPERGLRHVDREFYVMQGEIYTRDPFGEFGKQEFSRRKLLDEQPEYFVFNGAVGALSTEHPLKAHVGDTVRLFFGVGGPNAMSSVHLIGEHWDRVYDQASLTNPPLKAVQTTLVPPGGATVVEFTLETPGKFLLVDHALSRLERGLLGVVIAEGPPHPEILRQVDPDPARPTCRQHC